VLNEGCATEIAGLAALVLMLAIVSTPTASMFFAIVAAYPVQGALFASIAMLVMSIMTAVAFLSWMRRAIA
jgi:hypothetical protein